MVGELIDVEVEVKASLVNHSSTVNFSALTKCVTQQQHSSHLHRNTTPRSFYPLIDILESLIKSHYLNEHAGTDSSGGTDTCEYLSRAPSFYESVPPACIKRRSEKRADVIHSYYACQTHGTPFSWFLEPRAKNLTSQVLIFGGGARLTYNTAAFRHTLTTMDHPTQTTSFNIVATYRGLLASDPDLTMPVAAIESLVHLLASTPNITTISETLDVLETNITILKAAIPNAISLTAGTDMFKRYLITALRPGSGAIQGAGEDFKSIRQHLVSNGQVFVSRAKDARTAVAATAKKFVSQGSTVLTTGGSRAVLAALQKAATDQAHTSGAPRFKVIYVTGNATENESTEAVKSLRKLFVPVAVIPQTAVAYCMAKVSMVMVGAEGVVESGGIISRLGTYQMAALAKQLNKPFYVLAESHKFVRIFPLGQFDIPVEQHILDFSTEDTDVAESGPEKTPKPEDTYFDTVAAQNTTAQKDAVDYTPPQLITHLITEAGVQTTSAVSEALIMMHWDY